MDRLCTYVKSPPPKQLAILIGDQICASGFVIIFYHSCTESDSDDIHLLESVISIPSGAKRVPVSLEIIDDIIVEELYETIRINIAPTDGQQSLFTTGQYGTVTINIRDNDSKSIYRLVVQCITSTGGRLGREGGE